MSILNDEKKKRKKPKFNHQKQNFHGLKIVYTEEVFDKDKPRKGVKVVGRVCRDMPFVTKFNPKTLKQTFLTDYHTLPLNLKNSIIKDFASNSKRRILYLVDK